MYCRFQSVKEQVKSTDLHCSGNYENIINEYFDESYLEEFEAKCVLCTLFLEFWIPTKST